MMIKKIIACILVVTILANYNVVHSENTLLPNENQKSEESKPQNIDTLSQKQVRSTSVAVIGDTEFDDFITALNSAVDGDTVKLLQDTSITQSGFVIERNLTIDLNSKTLTISKSNSSKNVIEINGEVTITDNSTTKTGMILNTNGAYMKTLYVKGILNFQTGTLKCNKIADNYGLIYVANGGVANITGGKIECFNTSYAGSLIKIEHGGTFNMSGGQINYTNSSSIATDYVILNDGLLNLSKNAKIEGNRSQSDQLVLIQNGSVGSSTVANTYITGGTYTHQAKIGWSLLNNDSGQYLNITGGSFTSKLSADGTGGSVLISNSGDNDITGGQFLSEGTTAFDIYQGKNRIGGVNLKIDAKVNHGIIAESYDTDAYLSIIGGTITGAKHGVYNYAGDWLSIADTKIKGGSNQGVYVAGGSISKINHCQIQGGVNGLSNKGTIEEISDSTFIGESSNGILSTGGIKKITNSMCQGVLSGMDYQNANIDLIINGGTFKQDGQISNPSIIEGHGFINNNASVTIQDAHFLANIVNKAAYFNATNSSHTIVNSGRFTSNNGYGIINYKNGTIQVHGGYYKTSGNTKDNAFIKYDDNSKDIELPTDYLMSTQTKSFDDTHLDYHWFNKSMTLKYDKNGGTGTYNNETYVIGETIKLSQTKPSLINNFFNGWSYNGKLYKDGFKLTSENYQKIMTFIAHFIKNTETIIDISQEKPIHATVSDIDNLLKDNSVLSPTEKQIIDDMGYVQLILQMQARNQSDRDVIKMNNLVKNKGIGMYFEMSLLKKIIDKNDIETNSTLYKTNSLIKVTIQLDKEMRDKKNYIVYRLSKTSRSGSLETLSATPNTNGEYIKVNGDNLSMYIKELSTFGIGYDKTSTSVPETPDIKPGTPVPEEPAPETPVKPVTSDSTNILWYLTSSISTLVLLVYLFKKRKCE